MICPNCKCEYIRGITECADCGVPLVDALPPAPPALPDDAPIVLVWRGTGRGEYEKVVAALDDAGIPYTKANSRSLFSSRPNEPMLEIWVAETDREKAEQVAASSDGFVPEDLTPEQAAELSLPESSAPDNSDAPDDQPEALPEYWYEDGAAAEVWRGESEELADTLTACLREVGIPSHKAGESSPWSLVVPQKLESRAKEVVREVVEASPPQ